MLGLAGICCSRSQVSWLWCILGVSRSWNSLEHVMAWHFLPAPCSPLQICSSEKHIFIRAPSVAFPSLPWHESDCLGCENSRVCSWLEWHQDNVVLIGKMFFSLLCETVNLFHVLLALVTFRRLRIAKRGPFGVN